MSSIITVDTHSSRPRAQHLKCTLPCWFVDRLVLLWVCKWYQDLLSRKTHLAEWYTTGVVVWLHISHLWSPLHHWKHKRTVWWEKNRQGTSINYFHLTFLSSWYTNTKVEGIKEKLSSSTMIIIVVLTVLTVCKEWMGH